MSFSPALPLLTLRRCRRRISDNRLDYLGRTGTAARKVYGNCAAPTKRVKRMSASTATCPECGATTPTNVLVTGLTLVGRNALTADVTCPAGHTFTAGWGNGSFDQDGEFRAFRDFARELRDTLHSAAPEALTELRQEVESQLQRLTRGEPLELLPSSLALLPGLEKFNLQNPAVFQVLLATVILVLGLLGGAAMSGTDTQSPVPTVDQPVSDHELDEVVRKAVEEARSTDTTKSSPPARRRDRREQERKHRSSSGQPDRPGR